MEKKYCCERFKFLNSGPKEFGLNIRIVKYSKAFIDRGNLPFDKNCIMTEGYSGKITDCAKTVMIEYCPFCGTKLRKFYKSDDYVQEIIE